MEAASQITPIHVRSALASGIYKRICGLLISDPERDLEHNPETSLATTERVKLIYSGC